MNDIHPGDKVWFQGEPYLVDAYAGYGMLLLHDGTLVYRDDLVKDNNIDDQDIEDNFWE